MPISSIQATIAKLSIRPPGATDSAGEEPGGDLDALVYPCPATDPHPPSSFSPPLASPTDGPPSSPPNGLEASPPCATPPPPPASNHQPLSEAGSTVGPASVAPAPSSLELLATLTPEAFSMEGGGKGKQRVTKQNFLQPAEGQGLHRTRGEDEDDPLSSLDPLWSLGKH